PGARPAERVPPWPPHPQPPVTMTPEGRTPQSQRSCTGRTQARIHPPTSTVASSQTLPDLDSEWSVAFSNLTPPGLGDNPLFNNFSPNDGRSAIGSFSLQVGSLCHGTGRDQGGLPAIGPSPLLRVFPKSGERAGTVMRPRVPWTHWLYL